MVENRRREELNIRESVIARDSSILSPVVMRK